MFKNPFLYIRAQSFAVNWLQLYDKILLLFSDTSVKSMTLKNSLFYWNRVRDIPVIKMPQYWLKIIPILVKFSWGTLIINVCHFSGPEAQLRIAEWRRHRGSGARVTKRLFFVADEKAEQARLFDPCKPLHTSLMFLVRLEYNVVEQTWARLKFCPSLLR